MDIIKNIFNIDTKILNILLKDRTTKKNIIWATNNYEEYGSEYNKRKEIKLNLILSNNKDILKTRNQKDKFFQDKRTKNKAEVFTPSWICNKQNNLIDEQWFKAKNIFNIEKDNGWDTIEHKISFSNIKGKTWQDYVNSTRLEIACGEAPYLTSRYDSVSGEKIPLKDRIGFLDRKLRVITENTYNEDDWLKWCIIAYKNIYGYEFQGDNLLIARYNLLLTFIEYYEYLFNKLPNNTILKEIAKILSWNIWQMNGLTFCIPFEEIFEEATQTTIFDYMENKIENKTSIKCKIMDWKLNKSIYFSDLIKGANYE